MPILEQDRLFFEYKDNQGFTGKAEISSLLHMGKDLALKIATIIENRCDMYNYRGPVGELRSIIKCFGQLYIGRYTEQLQPGNESDEIVDRFFPENRDKRHVCWNDPQDLKRFFREFRTYYYKTTSIDKSLINRNADWAVLVRLINEDLIPAKIFVPFHVPKPNPKLSSRKNIDDSQETITTMTNGPFWEKSIVPISLSRSDEEYLDEYYRREKHAHNTFLACCRRDVAQIHEEIKYGEELIGRSNFEELCIKAKRAEAEGFPFTEQLVVPITYGQTRTSREQRVHMFSAHHPNGFSNALCWIKNKYGFFRGANDWNDLPKDLALTNSLFAPSAGFADGTKDIPKLLGLMTAERAVTLHTMIIAKTGKITPEALSNADAYDHNGFVKILTTLEGEETKRLTVIKGRAHSEKKEILDQEMVETINLVLKMTQPYRSYLKSVGSVHWNKLWLYQKQGRGAPQLIRPYVFQRQFSGSILVNKELTFLHRHPELTRYSSVKARNLRVSTGVVEWFETQGDVNAAARKLGNTVKVCMGAYIPKPVLNAMYRRQIRRHQNLLLAAAAAGEGYFLDATDFTQQEELHEFLTQMLGDSKRVSGNSLLKALNDKLAKVDQAAPDQAKHDRNSIKKIVVRASSESFAVLFLYKEHIENNNIDCKKLDNVDQRTGTSPWAWRELATACHFEMNSPVHRQLKPIYQKALELMDQYRGRIVFPQLEA